MRKIVIRNKKYKRKRNENEVMNAVCLYLKAKGYFFWRQNNQAVYDPTKKIFRRKPKFALNGVPDILMIKDGRLIGIETKTKSGRLSQNQKEVKEKFFENGASYIMVQEINDLIERGL